MITAFILNQNSLKEIAINQINDLLNPDIIWIDLTDPDSNERDAVESLFQFELPEGSNIKASARFYQNKSGTHIHSYFLNAYNVEPINVTVAFTLFQNRLFTVHTAFLSPFDYYQLRAHYTQSNPFNSETHAKSESNLRAMDLLIGLHDISVEHIADVIEEIYTSLEKISPHVLITANDSHKINLKSLEKNDGKEKAPKVDMDDILTQITKEEDINGKARLSLMDTRRSLSFLLRSRLLNSEQQDELREILLDIDSLLGHTAFLFEKINFLLDAAMGKISLEQSRIIKIFSIASVVFLPPTLIASIYGMNFEFMPELQFPYSYPISIGLMILSGIAPYLLFRRKGWL